MSVFTPWERQRMQTPPPVRNMATVAAAKPAPRRTGPPVAKPAPKHYDTTAGGVQAVLDKINARQMQEDDTRRKITALIGGDGNVFEVTIPNVDAHRARTVRNTLDERYGAAGGYTAANVTIADLYAAVRVGASPFRSSGATVIQRDAAVATVVPMVDIGNAEATVVAQGQAGPGIDQTFSARIVPPLKLVAGPTHVPYELVRDGKNLTEMVTVTQALMTARGESRLFTNGLGARTGIVQLAPVGVTAASSTAVSPDEVTGLLGAVETEYGDTPTAAFMMHRLVYVYLRKLKDASGRYIFKGPWGQLQGKPVRFNRWMVSTLSTGTVPILFGNWESFCIIDVNQPRISRYRDAPGVAEEDLLAIQTHVEVDWALLNPSPSFPPIVSLLMP